MTRNTTAKALSEVFILATLVTFLALFLISLVSERAVPLPPRFTSAFLAMALAFLFLRSEPAATRTRSVIFGVSVGLMVGLGTSVAYAFILLLTASLTGDGAFAAVLLPAAYRLLLTSSLLGLIGVAAARLFPARRPKA